MGGIKRLRQPSVYTFSFSWWRNNGVASKGSCSHNNFCRMFKSILILLQPSCGASRGKIEKVSFLEDLACRSHACNVAYLHFEWHTMRNGVGWIALRHFCNARSSKPLHNHKSYFSILTLCHLSGKGNSWINLGSFCKWRIIRWMKLLPEKMACMQRFLSL